MSTSPFQRFVRVRSKVLDGAEPVSVSEAMTVCGNVLHLADEAAQVRICAMTRSTNPFTLPENEYVQAAENGTVSAVAINYDPERIYILFRSGPIWLHVRPDGSAYPLRIRIATAQPNARSITWRAVLAGSPTASELATGDPSTDAHIAEWTSSSSSVAWLSADVLNLDLATIRASGMARSVFGARSQSDSDVVATEVVQVHLLIGVTNLDLYNDAVLYGAYLAEYIGT